jgi:hypothetical protein
MTEHTEQIDKPGEITDAATAELERKREELRGQMRENARVVIAALPVKVQALVPTNLTAIDQITWAANAIKSGVGFERPESQTGQRDAAEMARIPATARIAAGYKK